MRILDANANRAREALRVLEDYARFALNHDELSAALKEIRHGLAEATGPLLADAILHRDTPGDVGTDNKTAAEHRREDLPAVVTAAGKRLGEALRVIEETLKIVDSGAAAKIESLRYRFYDLEQKIARTMRPALRFDRVRLYVLITESVCRRPWLEAAEEAILGGADCLQLREKELGSGELLRRARLLVQLCRKHDVTCIINDRPDIAILSGADGVHVGQDDLPAAEARKIVGREMIVGVSTHRIEQARQAVLDGADYIGVGPIFRSSTKSRDFVAGLDYARQVVQEIRLPAVAIAGIDQSNVDQVLATGIRSVAVTAAVVGCDNVRQAAEQLKAALTSRDAPVGQTFQSASASRAGDIPALVGQTFLSATAGRVGDILVPPRPADSPSASWSSQDKTAYSRGELITHHRRLPHWRLIGSTYFVTFRTASGELSIQDRTVVLNHLLAGRNIYYTLVAAVVMPDHVHVLLRTDRGHDLSAVLKGTKGVSARLVNQARATSERIWQDGSWDRIVRDQAELDEKLVYMLNNPAKRGLVDDPWQYPWWFVDQEVH